MQDEAASRQGGAQGDVPEIHALTGLRAFACLSVLALHYNQAFDALNLIDYVPYISYGHIGVDLFFVLSGYIIALVYTSSLASFDRGSAIRFLILRIARLYPAHLTALGATLILVFIAQSFFSYTFNDPGNWKAADLVLHLTLTHAWGWSDVALWNTPSWSVSSEWLAYLTFPLLLPLLLRAGAIGQAIVALLALGSVLLVYGVLSVDLAASYRGWPVVFRVLSEFWLGAACYLLFRGCSPRRTFDLAALTTLALMIAAPSAGLPDFALVLLAPVLIVSLHFSTGIARDLASAHAVVWVGRISYSIYIIHFPVQLVLMYLYQRLGIPGLGPLASVAWTLSAMLVAVAAGWLLWLLVEEPARRRIKNGLRARSPATIRTG